MSQVSVNNVAIHYTESGEGTPLLLLHGLGGSHEIWLPVIPELAKSHRVVAADHRGHGASAKPRGSFSIRLFVEDWVALMEALRIDRAHVLGLSMGGAIAMRLAAEHSERVRSLVLVDTWAFPHPDFLAQLRQRLEALATEGHAAYAEAAIPQLYSPEFILANPKALADYRARVTSLDPGTLRSSVQACIDHDMREQFRPSRRRPSCWSGAKTACSRHSTPNILSARSLAPGSPSSRGADTFRTWNGHGNSSRP